MVVLMGPPGSGKGTQGSKIACALEVTCVSSGDLFREHQKNNTALGRLARKYMEQGVYVPDDVTIEMVMEWIHAPQQSRGFVLDGFPRTLAQATALDRTVQDRGGIDIVLNIELSQQELVRRLSGRLICRECQAPFHENSSPPREPGCCDRCGGVLYQRDDDRPKVVEKRIQVYNEESELVLRYYRTQGKIEGIDGEGSIEQVGKALIAAVI